MLQLHTAAIQYVPLNQTRIGVDQKILSIMREHKLSDFSWSKFSSFSILPHFACLYFLLKQDVQDVALCCNVAFELSSSRFHRFYCTAFAQKQNLGWVIYTNMDLRFILCDHLFSGLVNGNFFVSLYFVTSLLSWYLCTYHKWSQWPNCPSIWQKQTIFRKLQGNGVTLEVNLKTRASHCSQTGICTLDCLQYIKWKM